MPRDARVRGGRIRRGVRRGRRAAMVEAGIDALLITSEAQLPLPERPRHALLGQQDRGHLFWCCRSTASRSCSSPPARRRRVAATSPVADVRTYEGFVGAAIDLLEAALHDLGLAAGRIGAELGEEQRLGLPYADFADLQDRAARARPSSMPPRAVGLAYHQVAGRDRLPTPVGGHRQRRLPRTVRRRSSWHDRARGLRHLRRQHDPPGRGATRLRAGSLRRGPLPRISTGPTDRVLEPGDLLWLDGGCVVNGYWSDFARMVAIGQPTKAQRDRYRLVRRSCTTAWRPSGRA